MRPESCPDGAPGQPVSTGTVHPLIPWPPESKGTACLLVLGNQYRKLDPLATRINGTVHLSIRGNKCRQAQCDACCFGQQDGTICHRSFCDTSTQHIVPPCSGCKQGGRRWRIRGRQAIASGCVLSRVRGAFGSGLGGRLAAAIPPFLGAFGPPANRCIRACFWYPLGLCF